MNSSSTPADTLRRSALLTPAGLASTVVAVASLLHLAVMGRVALSVDEAHYALYGARLDWSYFDHPPMVGWLQALALRLGDSEWVLRLWPVALSVAASWLLYRLARDLMPGRSPWLPALAVGFLQSALVYQVLSFALVPEDPLLVFGLAAALSLFKAVRGGGTGAWLLTGLLFGLAGLSKYTAVLLLVPAVVFVATERQWRQLLTPGPWLAMGIALLLISPVLYWNATHDWISFAYQLGHGAPDRHWSISRFAASAAGQVLAYGPHVTLFGVLGLVAGWRDRHRPEARLLLALAAPVLLLFAWAGGYETTLPHWTLLGWVATLPLAAEWVIDHWQRAWVRRLFIGGAGFGLVVSLLLQLQFVTPWLPFAAGKHPLGDLYGWREAATEADRLLDRDFPARNGAIFVGNWTLASRIGWYARPDRVVVLDQRTDQFDLWYGSPRHGESGVLLTREGSDDDLPRRFTHCDRQAMVEPTLDGKPVHRFELWRCEGLLP